jgi:hypothetical protein
MYLPLISSVLIFKQGTREALRKHVEEFGECLKKDNDVGLIIDGQVLLCPAVVVILELRST